MTIAENLTSINNTKIELKQALQNATNMTDVAFTSYPNKVNELILKKWRPNKSWWDIEDILKKDRGAYPNSYIALITDANSKVTLKGAYLYKLSDGSSYSNTGSDIVHTWNTSLDKSCDDGYKTRYIIYYTDPNTTIQAPDDTLYLLMNCNVNANVPTWSNTFFFEKPLLQKFDFLNSYNFTGCTSYNRFCESCFCLVELSKTLNTVAATNFSLFCRACYSLTHLPSIDTTSCTNFDGFCRECGNLKSINITNILNNAATNFTYFLYYCASLTTIINPINIQNATALTGSLSSCYSLINVNLTNISRSLNIATLNSLNINSLMNIINNLQVVATNQTLTLGSINLAKLTPADIAIATNKNWTVN